VVLAVTGVVLLSATIVAFCTVMREIARASGSHGLAEQWQTVLRWQLGAIGSAILIIAFIVVTSPQASLAVPFHYEGLWALPLIGLILVVLVHPIIAFVRLLLHLRRSFGLRAMVERGDLVLRNDPASPAPAPAVLSYQTLPPPWESSVTLIADEHPARPDTPARGADATTP
jgi:hypothetical protein